MYCICVEYTHKEMSLHVVTYTVCFRLGEYVDFFCVTNVTTKKVFKKMQHSGTFQDKQCFYFIVFQRDQQPPTQTHRFPWQNPSMVYHFSPPLDTPGAVGRQGREAFPGITAAHVLVMQSGGYKALSPGWGDINPISRVP